MLGQHSIVFLSLLILAEMSGSLAFYRSALRKHAVSEQHRNVPTQDFLTLYIQQPVDHFGFSNQDTFRQRYLVVDKYWAGNNAPIFFYAGNEGDIVWFLNNTGLMFDWAPEFKAMLVFAEHRYYGESLPYGPDSYKDLKHLGYLSAEQALADFAVLIDQIKMNVTGAKNSPVVAFGGSYGGMLAAWFRMKYPHSIVGALASSAPIWLFGDLVPCDAYNQIVTEDFKLSGPNCVENIRKSWKVITEMGKTDKGRELLVRTFGLCKPLNASDAGQSVKDWLVNTWSSLPMVDYPYPASFLEPLPAWPLKVVCSHLSDPNLSGVELIQHLRDAVNVYYNYTGTTPCFNTNEEAVASLGDLGWDFQACSEMVMPSCSNGVTDLFENNPWDFEAFTKSCQKKWGVTPRPNWILEQFGGKNIRAASNIIFSNGRLDPWRAGGVNSNLSETLVAIMIEDGAHHLDLRSANPGDPSSVIHAREQEKQIVKNWIRGVDRTKKMTNSDVGCAFEKLVIINSVGGSSTNSSRPIPDSTMRIPFQQNILIFLILGSMFFGVIILVGFSGRRKGASTPRFMTNGNDDDNKSLI